MSADPRPVPADGQAMAADPRPAAAAQERRSRRALRRLDHWVLPAFTILAIVYLLMPIAVMIIYSFNDPVGKFNYAWNEFSLAAWQNPLGRPGLPAGRGQQPDRGRHRDAGGDHPGDAHRPGSDALLLPGSVDHEPLHLRAHGRPGDRARRQPPDALRRLGQPGALQVDHPGWAAVPAGLNTILIAHIMFCISFVVVTVRARIQGFDNNLEQAAGDLYANEWQTFWRVTFPLIFPGILAGALLAFSLSIDDFIVTNFASGTTNTFPIWVWSTIRNSLPPQVNVIGTIIFSLAVGLVVVSTLVGRYRAQRAMRPS